ncbi:SMI1/KNR4 family protein [Streptomyces xanthii]|uniref:SMI1/KNR4 family protein n=1 Tax=Streptomyces xanthii TaxID=2768069 RepID=UPI001CB793AB|nr:SMI1/KNR4 family protein [Streptomyces xanthii]
MDNFGQLVERVVVKAAESERLQLPVSVMELDEAERRLGFRLHPLLAALYLKVGNGGFGPMDSLLPLTRGLNRDGEEAVVDDYLGRIPTAGAVTWWSWPRGVLPVLDWGCGMFACVDCRGEGGAVLHFDPNVISGQDVSRAWFVEAGSLAEWLETWLAGRGWYQEDVADGGFALPSWPEASVRL